jgi:hypothetical protein
MSTADDERERYLAYAAMTDAAEPITVLVPTVDLAPLVSAVAAWTVGEPQVVFLRREQ